MKKRLWHRAAALVLCLALSLSLLSGAVFAANELWVEAPTGWVNWGHVIYRTVTVNGKQYICNWGVRGELCRFQSLYAREFYPDLYDGQGVGWGYDIVGLYDGGTGQNDAVGSELFDYLHDFLEDKQTHVTSYAETKDLYRLTDCMVNNPDFISSFYSGIKLNGAWDSGKTWNREHTWPNSKISGNGENDIMMLRPTSVQENTSRGNTAYGESTGYYHPNSEAGTSGLDLRGDCARICLYVYVRWSENAGNMWGQSGVMENLEVLLNWMEEDPVDTWEMGRNDAVQSITGVRNCFVDYPELAWAVFGRQVPEDYPTPFKGDHNNFVSAPACLDARSCNEEWGTVDLRGWAVDCCPAEGYYASGYDVYTINGDQYLGEGPWNERFHWEHDDQRQIDKLLYTPVSEEDYLVEIHFTPEGETDPCPTGHDWDGGVITIPPTTTEPGERTYTCARCGRTRTETLPPAQLFNVILNVSEGGTVEGCPTQCLSGEEIVLAVRPDETYRLESIIVAPLNGEIMDITETGAFTMPWSDVIVDVLFVHVNPFTDVPEDKYYCQPVLWAYYHDPQVTSGTGDTTFSPNRTCTREQIVTFLWKAAGAPAPETTDNPFTDVTEGKYYYDAVLWAVENEITGGMSETSFGVGKPCTREQAVTFLWKAAGAPEPETADNPFTDVIEDKYYYKAVLWAVENEITSGVGDGLFGGKRTCTRGQIVTFLWKAWLAGAIDAEK